MKKITADPTRRTAINMNLMSSSISPSVWWLRCRVWTLLTIAPSRKQTFFSANCLWPYFPSWLEWLGIYGLWTGWSASPGSRTGECSGSNTAAWINRFTPTPVGPTVDTTGTPSLSVRWSTGFNFDQYTRGHAGANGDLDAIHKHNHRASWSDARNLSKTIHLLAGQPWV